MEREVQAEEGAVEGDLYEVDEGLSPLEAVLAYSRSELEPQRHAYIRGIGAIALQVVQSSRDNVAGTDIPSAGDLHELLSLVQQLLAVDGPWSDDPDSLALTLAQLQPLGQALCAVSDDNASTLQQLHTLCDAVLHTLLAVCDHDEELAHQCVTSLASLLSLLPAEEACTTTASLVRKVLADGGSQRHVLATELLGTAATSANMRAAIPGTDTSLVPDSSIASKHRGKLQAALIELVTQVTNDEQCDETAQQALLRSLGPISVLMASAAPDSTPSATNSISAPTESTSPHSLVWSVCSVLSSSMLWNVRAAVAAAIPSAIAAIAGALQCTAAPAAHAASTQRDISVQSQQEYQPLDKATASVTSVASDLCRMLCDVLGKDVSPWVRSAAIKAAGPALTQMPGDAAVPAPLISLYCECVGGVKAQPPDVLQAAAAAFASICQRALAQPASIANASGTDELVVAQPVSMTNASGTDELVVAQPVSVANAIGRDVSCTQHLVHTFIGLCKSGDAETVRQLVFGLPVTVKVLGASIAQKQLLPTLMQLQPEEQRAVAKQAMVCHIAGLLDVLPAEAYTDVLHFVLSEHMPGQSAESGGLERNHVSEPGIQAAASEDGSHVDRCGPWRDRLALAQQLGRLALSILNAAPSCLNSILPCAMSLCSDPVSAVRQAAAEQLGSILLHGYSWDRQHALSGNNDAANTATVSQSALQSVLQLVGIGTGLEATGKRDVSMLDIGIERDVPCRLSDLNLFAAACNGFVQAAHRDASGNAQQQVAALQPLLHNLQALLCVANAQCLQDAFHAAQQLADVLCTCVTV